MDVWEVVVRPKRPQLIRRLTNTDDIRTECYSKKLIEADEYERLYSARNNKFEHNEQLLNFLASGGQASLQKFIVILRSYAKYEDLVKELEKGLQEKLSQNKSG